MQVRKLVVLAVFAVLLAGMGSATLLDDFEDGDISEYSGDTGQWEASTDEAFSGTYSVEHTPDNSAHGIWNSTTSVDFSQTVNLSAYFYYGGSGTEERGGPKMFDTGSGGGYNVQFEPQRSTCLRLRETSSTTSFTADIASTSSGCSSLSSGNWYKLILEKDGNTYTAWAEDTGGNTVVGPISGTDSTESPDSWGVHAVDSTTYMDDLECSGPGCPVENQPPTINSIDTEPAGPQFGDDVNVTANVTDPDGDAIANVSATVLEDGVQIADEPMPATTGDLFKAVDAFTADETNVWYNITITAEDSNGATSTSEINFRVEDDAPTLTVKDPKNQSYTSIPPYKVLINDTDDVPGETFNWAVWVNNAQEATGSGTENLSISGFLNSSSQGFNTFKVNATDDAGNLESQTVNYTFDNVPPVVNIDSPTGNVTVDDARSVDLNFTVTDATSSVNGCIINPNNGTGNFTQATCQNTTLIYSSNGDKTVEIWADDTAGNTEYAFSDFNIRIENRLRALDADTNNLINSFTAEFSNGTAAFDTTRSTTNGEVTPFTRNLPTGPSVTVDVSATGYNDNSTTLNVNDTTAFDANITLSPVSISYEVFDESTQDYLENPALITVSNGTHEEIYGVLNKFKEQSGTTEPAAAFDRNLNTNALISGGNDGDTLEGYVAFERSATNTLFIRGRVGTGGSGTLQVFNGDTQSWDDIQSDPLNSTTFTYEFTVNNTGGEYDNGRVRINNPAGSNIEVNEIWAGSLTTVSVPTDEVLLGNTTIRVNDIRELDDYRPRTFFAEITNQDRNIHTYLLKRSQGITASVRTVDELEQDIANARVTLTREFGFDTAVIAQRETASGGTATFFVDPDEVYGLNASKTGFESFSGTFNGQPYQFSPFVITLESLADIALPDSRFEVLGLVDYTCTQFNVSLFNCSYSHSSSSISSLNLTVDQNQPIQTTNVCTLGSTLGSDELRCTGLNVTNTSYQYVFSATLTDGNKITLESGFLSTVQNNYGDFGLFAYLLLLAVLTLGALWLPEVTILVAALTVPLAYFTGILAVSPTAVISLIAVALILLWRLSS